MPKTFNKVSLNPREGLYPNPVVLVSCSHDGADNIITLAWIGTVCSDPKLLGIGVRPSRYSHSLIKEKGEFVINQPTVELLEATEYCGTKSGRDHDKWVATGLTKTPGKKVDVPHIAECPVSIECVVQEVFRLGVHDLFIGEIVGLERDEDWKKTYDPPPLVYMGGHYGRANLLE